MKLKSIAANQTEITIGGTRILFSYSTPVACIIAGAAYRTAKKWSVTTASHINSWCSNAETRPQKFFNALVS